MVRVLGRTRDLSGGWGRCCYGDWARLDRAGAGLGRKGGLTWALVGGSSLQLSGPGPDSFGVPAAGAGSGSGSAAIYGAWMGRGGGGPQHQLPPLRTDRLGGRRGEGQGHCLGGATEPEEEEGGLGVAQTQDPCRQ